MRCCIAEKPSVAESIAKVLGARTRKDGYYEGNGYWVTWTFGHLCQLKAPDAYNPQWKRWDIDELPMIPSKYEVELLANPGIKKQFKVIKSLFSRATEIINCGDAGQEGELIQRWVMQLAGVKCPVKRLWISSLTEESIRQGFQHLQPQSDYDALFEAGLARAEGDWLLGLNATRLYTLKYGRDHQVLSIGRVQTPTLAMIVARDNEIEHFQSHPYWVLTTRYRDTLFTCTQGRFDSEEKARRILTLARQGLLTIKDVQQNRGSELPPQLYDLNALQVEANKKFGMTADVTLKTIQGLYEKKLTTYPRVDTRYLTDDLYAKCPAILASLTYLCAGARPLVGRTLIKSNRVFDNSRVSDHHAIIPTGDTRNITQLNDQEFKVYGLIVRRFCAVFYPACEYAQTTVTAQVAPQHRIHQGAGGGSLTFCASGRTILQQGWRAAYGTDLPDNENGEEGTVSLPAFQKGESGFHTPALQQKQTTPPKRYTDASLLQKMESINIGRPSSRAGIIETLLKRDYVRREKRNLVSTPTGRNLMVTIRSELLKSPELTAQWEEKLAQIEHGKYSLSEFMNELQQQLETIVRDA